MEIFFFVLAFMFFCAIVGGVAIAEEQEKQRRRRPPLEDADQKAARLRAESRALEEQARFDAASVKAEMARAELEDTRNFLKTRNDPKRRVGHA